MKNINWNEVEEAKDFERVTPGGYICGITAVKDEPDKEYLKIEFDIIEGKFKGHYKSLYESKGFWGGSFIRSYKPAAQPFFKGFLTAVENSNSGFHFDNDESKLRGKVIGLVLAEKEYIGNNDSVKKRLYVSSIHSVDKIKKGEFEVPELKRLKTPENSIDDMVEFPDNDSLPWEN